jgi:hypothetical protein
MEKSAQLSPVWGRAGLGVEQLHNDEVPMKVTPLLVEFVHCLLLEVQ